MLKVLTALSASASCWLPFHRIGSASGWSLTPVKFYLWLTFEFIFSIED